MKKFLLLPLALLLLISGCIGTFPVSPAQTQTKQETADLLVIENVKVIPSLVFTNTEFTVSFRIRHVGDPKTSKPVTARITAYDFGPCKGSFSKTVTLYPGQIEYFEIKVNAPSDDEIAHLEAKCPIRIKLEYDYTATTQYEVYVMSGAKYEELAKSGKEPSHVPTQNIGIGPVKIYFDFQYPQPIKSGTSVTFFIYARNLGSGDVSASNVRVSGASCDTPYEIKFIGGETTKFKCTAPFSLPSGNEEKTYYLIAKMDYTYSIEKNVEVTVKPLPSE